MKFICTDVDTKFSGGGLAHGIRHEFGGDEYNTVLMRNLGALDAPNYPPSGHCEERDGAVYQGHSYRFEVR